MVEATQFVGGAPPVKWPVLGCPPKIWGVPPYQMPWRDTTEFEAGGICILDVQNSRDLTRFLGHVLSYRLMTDEQLGRSDLIKSDEDGNYIMTRDAVVGPDFSNKFYIQAKPIALHGDQVSAGTTCYLARMPQLD